MAARLLPPSPAAPDPAKDALAAARSAGLRYVTDHAPGIRRRRAGKGFSYLDPDGKPVRDEPTMKRIRSLAIPPAWTDVWICPHANGHVQATGRDAKGRKQYRYHSSWRQARDETKYDRMMPFAKSLPRIRARVEEDLARPGLPREKVLAALVRLLETTFMRVGNEEYAKTNRSYGLTTLRDQHVDVTGGTLRFQFRGKAGKVHRIDLRDKRLARIVKRCQDLPGQELFQYLDEEGEQRSVTSSDVNDYLREISGQDFTAKDFRTWAGTVLAAMALREMRGWDKQAEAKKNVVRAIERVAERLGNTPAVCRKCYVHPGIIDSYLDGMLAEALERRIQDVKASSDTLRPEEAAVLALLERRLAEEAGAGGSLALSLQRSLQKTGRR